MRFRRAVTLMVMTLLLPGSAQIAAGNRKVGRIALRIWLVTLGVGLFFLLLAWAFPTFTFTVVFKLGLLHLLRFALMLLAVGWAALFIDAWRLGQPLTLVKNQRLAIVGINGVLCFSVAGTLLFSAHLVGTGQSALAAVFGADTVYGDAHGRYNVLLLGGDSGAGRWGLRPDSITVASIDAETGRTVLIGLPRNLAKFRFKEGSAMDEQFPDGFDCDGCYLNGVATWALDNKELFPGSKNPGVDATIQAVEGITGLDVSYWAMVNLAGFRGLVDAVGGVTLNVRARIPIGLPHDHFYSHIEPGRKKLNGFEALWFARARDGSDDYSRMARQKCVMNALLQQIDPQTVIRNFGKIAKAGTAMLTTNLPQEELVRFADLARKAKEQKMATVSIAPPAINTGNPDLGKIRDMIEKAIDKAEGKAGKPAKAPRRKPAGEVRGGSIGTLQKGYAANQADDLAAAC